MQVSGMHWQVPPVQVKFSLPVPLGQLQLTVVQPLFTCPQAMPMAAPASVMTGQVAGRQHFPLLHVSAGLEQLQVTLPPQPLLNVPHWAPFIGTLAHVYAIPMPSSQAQVPTLPAVVVEHIMPPGQLQLMVPP
jgi:hypothetical protein